MYWLIGCFSHHEEYPPYEFDFIIGKFDSKEKVYGIIEKYESILPTIQNDLHHLYTIKQEDSSHTHLLFEYDRKGSLAKEPTTFTGDTKNYPFPDGWISLEKYDTTPIYLGIQDDVYLYHPESKLYGDTIRLEVSLDLSDRIPELKGHV